MTALDRIAFFLNRRDEVPNQELARDLADKEDLTSIREIAEGLKHKNPQVQSDCLKVLYEIAYLKPELISAFTSDFLHLLHSRNNRLVWGAMIALAEVTPLQAEKIHAELDLVLKTFAAGSVITIDNSIKILARLAVHSLEYRREIFPLLIEHLRHTRAADIPRHAEYILPAVDKENHSEFNTLLLQRLPELTPPQVKRVRHLLQHDDRFG